MDINPETIRATAELAKAIPPDAWKPTAEMASRVVEQFLAPVTATTSGIAELIRARFERLTSLERINTEAMLDCARIKIEASEKPIVDVDAKVIVSTLENAALESNPELRELWANLLARQFTDGDVHPLFPEILSKLRPEDARALAAFRGFNTSNITVPGVIGRDETFYSDEQFRDYDTLSNAALAALGLVRQDIFGWHFTPLGRDFLATVKSSKVVEQE